MLYCLFICYMFSAIFVWICVYVLFVRKHDLLHNDFHGSMICYTNDVVGCTFGFVHAPVAEVGALIL